MAGTAWNAGLRPAQRPAGPRRRRPQSPGWLPSRHIPPTDEMAYSRRRHGRDGLEPPPGERGQPPAGTRGSAKPGRMTRRQTSVSATHFLPGGVCGGPDHAGSCRWDSIERPPGSRAVPCRPPSRNAGTWPALHKRCLPLPCTDPAERGDSRREGATSELGVLPAARLRRAVPAGGRRSKPSAPLRHRLYALSGPSALPASGSRLHFHRNWPGCISTETQR